MMGGFTPPPYSCPGGCGARAAMPFPGPCFDCALASTPLDDPAAVAFRKRQVAGASSPEPEAAP